MNMIRVNESDYILGKFTRPAKDLSPHGRVSLVREMLRLTVRRKDNFFSTLDEILLQDWCSFDTPKPKKAVRKFRYMDHFDHLPLEHQATMGGSNFLPLAHHKYFPIPQDMCSELPDPVESEHLLLVRPQANKDAQLARWAITWEPHLDDLTKVLDWSVIKHEFSILDDVALGEQLKKPHLSVLAYNGFESDPVFETMHIAKVIELRRSDRRESSYRIDSYRSAEFKALLKKVGW